jgi:predicted glycosyltransferase
MAGYNTVWETLSYGKPCLLAPRVSPRREQWIRAQRLAELGLVDVIPPEQVNAAAIAQWLGREASCSTSAREVLDMGGIARLPHLLNELLSGRETTIAGSAGSVPSAEVATIAGAEGGAPHARA